MDYARGEWLRDPGIVPPADAASVDASPVDAALATIRNTSAKIGRNDPCPCGSGKKFKKCRG